MVIDEPITERNSR